MSDELKERDERIAVLEAELKQLRILAGLQSAALKAARSYADRSTPVNLLAFDTAMAGLPEEGK